MSNGPKVIVPESVKKPPKPVVVTPPSVKRLSQRLSRLRRTSRRRLRGRSLIVACSDFLLVQLLVVN
jgi:hypothetical protein